MKLKQITAERLCLAYFVERSAIRQCTKRLGELFPQCPKATNENGEPTLDSHLATYYEAVKSYCNNDVIEELEDVQNCPFCREAHALIQQRRTSRRKLGAIKSAIVRHGSTLAAELATDLERIAQQPEPEPETEVVF